jgi:uncharacterized protein (UPF0276 family)
LVTARFAHSRNRVISPENYVGELDPDTVEEIHFAGGDAFGGFFIDPFWRRAGTGLVIRLRLGGKFAGGQP